MKRIVLVFTACFAATVVSALAFVNNAYVVVKWWKLFLASGGDTAMMKEKIPGFIPCLDWANVDYSTVTTLIPLIGFFFMTLGAFKLLRGKRINAEDFPFFKGSDQLHVALGLFGTLWGIILIGYFNLDTVAMADLMQCLHTALFSTLMAVVWVFLIDRPIIRPYFIRLANVRDLVETDDGDLADSVDRFIVRLGKAADAFDARQVAFEKASAKRQEEYSAATNKMIEAADAAMTKRISDADTAITKMFAQSEEAFQKRISEYEKEFEARQKEYVEVFQRRIEALQAEANESRARADASNARLAAVTKALQD